MIKTYVVIPKIQIQNANAMSSTYTIGFPAMTAWLGAVHALQRKVASYDADFSGIQFAKTAVVCHACNLQVQEGYRKSLIGTANPLKKNKKSGKYERPPFIAEARVHLTVSLIIETSRIFLEHKERFEAMINELIGTMKIASGDVIAAGKAEVMYVDDEEQRGHKAVIAKVMPGYALIERRDLLQRCHGDGLMSMLEFLKVHAHAEKDDDGNVLKWQYERTAPGWIVPISVGFKGISPLANVQYQRDAAKDHRFAENVLTLGEFKMPYRFDTIDDMMWHYEYDADDAMYICKNQD